MSIATTASKVGLGIPAPAINVMGMLTWFFWVGLSVAVIWFLWPRIMYPLVIEYWEIRGGRAHRAKVDYGKPVMEDGVPKVKLFKHKKKIKNIEPQFMFQISKSLIGLSRDKVYMVKDMNGELHPAQLHLTPEAAFFKSAHGDVQFYAQQIRKKKIEKYMLRGFWREQGPLIAMGAVSITCLVVIILTIKWTGNAVSEANGAVAAVSEAVNNLATAMKSGGGGGFAP